jgi:outer membrane biosynthesis protein TonB
VRSSTSKIALALLLSIAMHSLLFLIPHEPVDTYLSQHSIIHARLDKQDKELIQQEQTGQISQQHNEKISEASDPSETRQDQPLKQEATKAQEKSQDQPVISSKSRSEQKALDTQPEDTPTNVTQETEIEELVEKTEVAATKPTAQQSSQVSSDSRAQVEALEGSEDPTYTSYRNVLTQYLNQRLTIKAEYKGSVRLRIKLEYGSIATHVEIIQSSGNLEIDSWTKKAALSANPYPKIPKEIGTKFEWTPTFQFSPPVSP